MASCGDSTIGSPPTLKEVFNNTGTPVLLKNSCSNEYNLKLSDALTVCTLALLSMCVIEGNCLRFDFKTVALNNMCGEFSMGKSNQDCTSSLNTIGAYGLQLSLYFILLFK